MTNITTAAVTVALCDDRAPGRIKASPKLTQDEKDYLLLLIGLKDGLFAGEICLEDARPKVRKEDWFHFPIMQSCIEEWNPEIAEKQKQGKQKEMAFG